MRQHGIIAEANVAPTTSLDVAKSVKFKGGYYSIANADATLKKELDEEMEKIKNFLNKSTGKVNLVSVQITSSESQIPNTDRELGGKEVSPKYLAKKRSDTIQKYITEQLKSFENKLISIPVFDIKEPVIGRTSWVGQPFCPKSQLKADDPEGRACAGKTFAPKDSSGKQIQNYLQGRDSTYGTQKEAYETEQNMSVKLKLMDVANVQKCLTNMEIQVNYTQVGKGHTCNSAVFKISVNGVTLKRNDGAEYASLNNGSDKYDNNPNSCARLNQVKNDIKSATPILIASSSNDRACARYNKFILGSDLANEILGKSAFNVTSTGVPKMNLQATCLSDDFYDKPNNKWGGCHTGVGDIVITNGLGKKFEYQGATPRNFNQTVVLATLDACGAKI